VAKKIEGVSGMPKPAAGSRPLVSRRDFATRVARWYFFKQKITIWVNFWEPRNGNCWHILWPLGKYYINLVLFIAILLV
jgi:hypothetical protein